METISRSLLTFLLNALWQIPLAAAVAALGCWFLRKGPAGHRHAVWVATLATAILLPATSMRRAEVTNPIQFPPSLASQAGAGMQAEVERGVVTPAAPASRSRTIALGGFTATVLLGGYLVFLLLRLARLMWASLYTVRLRHTAQTAELPTLLDRVRNRCEDAFGLTGVELLFSRNVSGPVTAGGAIILPESLLGEESDDVLTTVIGHEMAHIARHDFTCQLVYELLLLPVSFHPAAWLIRRGIERTREMACDEMVTHRLIDRGVYARSIMSIAIAMTAVPRPGYTLGVFDGDILEERIRRLVERPAANLKRARLLLAGGLAAVAVCAVVASTLSLTARAQGPAGDLTQEGKAAFNRRDYKTAAGVFETVVRLQPDNLEAKLLMADSLVQQYVPGTDPANPLVTAARQQYLDVLGRDPGNKRAIHGMMILSTNSKQWTEAHEWAQKAIQADAGDASAYYTAGFLDWAITYPDYAAARQAAGMKPPDPGIIPDAVLRQAVRTQHMAHIEDGHRMLEMALQLAPDYSDAMAYINLLYRIEAGIAYTPAESAEMVSKADEWVRKALEAKRKQRQSNGAVEPLGPPPPPPPPPPPSAPGIGIEANAPQRIRIGGAVQASKLVKETPPVYPPAARHAGITGTVSLSVAIGKDGTVQHIEVVSGPAQLAGAAIEAVRRWVYQPTLLNGNPVEVATTVNVTFE